MKQNSYQKRIVQCEKIQYDNFCNIFFALHQLSADLLKKIKDYDLIMRSKNIKDKLEKIESVYMESIILDMAKITSSNRSDKSGIKELQEISPALIKQEIADLLSDNKSILYKIKANRNRKIAHFDMSKENSFINMGFSEIQIDTMINDYKDGLEQSDIIQSDKDLSVIAEFRKVKSCSSDNERYSISDFSSDLPEFKKIIEKIIMIANKLNHCFHTTNKKPI